MVRAILPRLPTVRGRHRGPDMRVPAMDAVSAAAGARVEAGVEAGVWGGVAEEPPANEEIILCEGSKVKHKQIHSNLTERC